MDVCELKKVIRERLDDYRYNHSLCVADEAVRLAELYGGDKDRAYIAGLLHDITKNDTEFEHLLNFSKFDIILTDIEKCSQKLWHAISGAGYVENILQINDLEILDAIRYHTTARAGMTKLEKIVYLADFTSADRKYDDVDVMRGLVQVSMEKAMIYALGYTITELVSKECAIHPDTIAAYNELVLN